MNSGIALRLVHFQTILSTHIGVDGPYQSSQASSSLSVPQEVGDILGHRDSPIP